MCHHVKGTSAFEKQWVQQQLFGFIALAYSLHREKSPNIQFTLMERTLGWRVFVLRMLLKFVMVTKHLSFSFHMSKWTIRIHVFSMKQNSGTDSFQTEHCMREKSGTRKFQEYQFFMEFKKFFGENSRFLFWAGQKIPGFLTSLNSRNENSMTNFPKQISWIFQPPGYSNLLDIRGLRNSNLPDIPIFWMFEAYVAQISWLFKSPGYSGPM